MNKYLEVDQISVLPTLADFPMYETKLKLRANQMRGKGRKALRGKNCRSTRRVVFTFSSAS